MFQPGDIAIFDTDGSWWDAGIMLVSNSTHVSFFTLPDKYIEANIRGIEENEFSPRSTGVRVYRMPEKYSQNLWESIEMARIHKGDKYSVLGAVFAGLLRMVGFSEFADKIDRNWICSEFVGYILRYGLKADILDGVAVRSFLPDDIERFLISDGWQIIHS